jgi:YidC/Oxa1 family membrane protein insertase
VQNIFGFIIHPMELGVIWLTVALGSAGIGIIVFTILVRLILAPLNIIQLRNAKSMQRLQPLIGDLRKKHGKDREALSKATMELYREHNVNPAMGCLPTLLQFPVLIGLFYALLHLGSSVPTALKNGKFPVTTCNNVAVHTATAWYERCYAVTGMSGSPSHVYDLFHATFLWLSDGLGRQDPLLILPILAAVTQWVQSRMMLTKSNDQQQQMMNSMMNFVPIMIFIFAMRYPSGLSLYWVTSTLIGIAIQYRITGLGLLPSTLQSLGRLAGGVGTSRALAPARSSRPNPTSTPRTAAKPPADKPAKTPLDAPKAELNGQDNQNGASGDSSGAIRRRKPANRPRGGKRSGRRG